MKFICKKCGSTDYKIIEKSNGNGIATGLYCAKCGQWQKWLNKQEKVLFAEDMNSTAEVDALKRDVENLTRTLEEVNEEYRALRAENAELKARLEKAVELKAKIGDRLYTPWGYDGNNGIATWLIIDIHFHNGGLIYITSFVSDDVDCLTRGRWKPFRTEDFGNKVFTNRTEAEKRLAELQEEEK